MSLGSAIFVISWCSVVVVFASIFLLRAWRRWNIIFVSKIEGHEGECKHTWLNYNIAQNILNDGVTGFFKKTKRWCNLPFCQGEEFHGIIRDDGKVYSMRLKCESK